MNRPVKEGHATDRLISCPGARRRHLAKGETCEPCGANVDGPSAGLIEEEVA